MRWPGYDFDPADFAKPTEPEPKWVVVWSGRRRTFLYREAALAWAREHDGKVFRLLGGL